MNADELIEKYQSGKREFCLPDVEILIMEIFYLRRQLEDARKALDSRHRNRGRYENPYDAGRNRLKRES